MTPDQGLAWAELCVRLLDTLVWPGFAALVVILFAEEISDLIRNTKWLRFGSAEAGFLRDEMADAQTTIQSAGLKPSADRSSDHQRLLELAGVSPRTAIIESWIILENSAREFAESRGITDSRVLRNPVRIVLELLGQYEDIGPDLAASIASLRDVRNLAAHSTRFNVSESESASYVDMANIIADTFRSTARR